MNSVLAAVIPLVFLLLIIAAIFYAGSRLRTHLNLRSRLIVTIVFAAAIIGSLIAVIGAVKSADSLVGLLNIAGGYILIFSFYLLVCLLIAHFLQSAVKLAPSRSIWGVLALALIPTLIGAWQALSFKVSEETIQVSKLKEKIDIVLITDMHLGHYRGKDYLQKIVEETNARNPKFILIAGDLLDSEAALFPEILSPLSQFNAPVYYVAGNHEHEIDEQKALGLIAQNGVKVLHNEVVNAQGIQLIGLDYMKADENTFDMHPSANKNTIRSVLSELQLNKETPTILLHHSPVGAKYASAAGVDLVVAGHTHAGQIFPFTYLNAAIFEYNKGLYELNNTKIFVSQGAGTFFSRVRMGAENEINFLHLIPKS